MVWNDDINKLKEDFNTDLEKGLTDNQAASLLQKNGPNALATKKKKSIFTMILEHLLEPFTFVLLALLVIAAVLNKWAETIVIALIISLEMFLSILQERKAMASLDSLKKLVKEHAVVIRDGKKYTIDVKKLVVGDLVYLEAGMFLPADVRIIQSFNLRINESLLTGESNLVIKTTDPINKENLAIGDRTNMAFMSTMIAAGSGLGIVIATGKNTEIGKISELIQEEKDPKSPLAKQITFFVRVICLIALALGAFIFCMQFFVSNASWSDSLVFTIALVVAVIPEGLKVIVTVSLSLGSRRMAKRKAIVKQLNAVETLGQVSVICSDKTGTLTENRMTVKKYFLKGDIEEADDLRQATKQEKLFLNALVLANNGTVTRKRTIGDPTEIAFLKWADNLKQNAYQIQKSNPRIHELPFDSERKLMSTVNKYKGEQYLFVKGAPDNLIKNCSHYLIDNKKMKITKKFREELNLQLQNMSDQALRVLGAAYRELGDKHDFNDIDRMEKNLVFLGLAGMIDPPRKEVKDVLVETKAAGIDTKMITGDHLNTAVAIGKELGILHDKKQAINGEEIEKISDKKLKKDIHKYQVFARVSPEHKVRVVKALQANNNIVSMTGDGVNDAPSLKAANIGVAMGITGTDVTKEAAQLVLLDDNFLTIVDAIEEGRNIYNKLKRIICFILITNLSQVLAVTVGMLLNWGDLLKPLQILWINLIVESFLAITISMGPNDPKLMKEKPIHQKENILKGSWRYIIFLSIVCAGILLLVYKFLPLVFDKTASDGETYAFVFMVNAPVFYSISFSVGMKNSIFNRELLQNKAFWISVAVSFALNLGIVFIPGVHNAFEVDTNIGILAWLTCFVIAIVPMIFFELYKFIIMNFKFKKEKKKETPKSKNKSKSKNAEKDKEKVRDREHDFIRYKC